MIGITGGNVDARQVGVADRRRHLVLGAALAATLLLLAVACGDDAGDSAATTSPAAPTTSAPEVTTTAAASSALSPGDRYVALGSSIASGFGIPEQSTPCGRSSRSYPQLLADHYDLELADVTCGAASIPNLVDQPQGDNPPQIEAVTPDTGLVTISIGGNDIGYNATALLCGLPTTCEAPATLDADLEVLPGLLTSVLDAVRAAAPDAVIVFVTYPREVPEGNCPALSLADAEASIVRSMGERLEQAFVDVVAATDVVFVDPYVGPGDHTGCAPESQRWTAGNEAPGGTPFHPTALGHEVMADLVIEALG